MDAKRWGVGGSNLSVHWTLTVRKSYFDSPLNYCVFLCTIVVIYFSSEFRWGRYLKVELAERDVMFYCGVQ